MNLTIVAGARPNFVKIAPLIQEICKAQKLGNNIDYTLVHTGQHYDKVMSQSFFNDLGIPEPDVNLNAGGGSQAEQTGAIMVGFEEFLANHNTDMVIVVGDVTSTLACSIVAKKAGIDVAHVEAGIRSGDLSMPEEINRMVTDSISDYFFTTSRIANENLKHLGFPEERIHFVGNTMIDTLVKNMGRLRKPSLYDKVGLKENSYLVLTLHRPANVDQIHKFVEILKAIESGTDEVPVVFPVHPRTRKIIDKLNVEWNSLYMIDPLGYLEFNYLVKYSKGVITDSGGITEEATFMAIPCITLRDNTERPETITLGTNELAGTNPEKLFPFLEKIINNQWKEGQVPELWDGNTAQRIVKILLSLNQK